MKVSFLLPLILCLGLHQVYGTEKVKWLSSCSRRSDETLLKLHSWRSGNLENLKESYEILQIRKRHTVSKKAKMKGRVLYHVLKTLPLYAFNSHHEVLPHFIAPSFSQDWIAAICALSLNPIAESASISRQFQLTLQGTSALPEWLRRYGNISWHWGRRFHLNWIEDLLSCWNWVEKTQISWKFAGMPGMAPQSEALFTSFRWSLSQEDHMRDLGILPGHQVKLRKRPGLGFRNFPKPNSMAFHRRTFRGWMSLRLVSLWSRSISAKPWAIWAIGRMRMTTLQYQCEWPLPWLFWKAA